MTRYSSRTVEPLVVAVVAVVFVATAHAARGQPEGYPSAEAVRTRLLDLAASKPEICRAVDLTVRYGQDPTHQGRHLHALKISANAGEDEDEPALLFVAAHHGDEFVTVATALHGAEMLVGGYGEDEAITALLDTTEVWVAPVWNPDGYSAGTRVNGRVNGDGTVGVDLNRNYPFGFGECGGSAEPGRGTFHGPEAASEPETRTMIAFAQDRRFAIVHDAHAGAFDLRFGYGCGAGHPWREMYGDMAAQIIETTGLPLPPRSSCCLAGDIHLHMSTTLSTCFLWELGKKSAPLRPARKQAEHVWRGVLLSFGSINLSGHVIDGETGAPLSVRIEVVEGGFERGEHGTSNVRFGRFDLVMPDGAHELRFSASGYEPTTEVAVIREGEHAKLQVVLFPR